MCRPPYTRDPEKPLASYPEWRWITRFACGFMATLSTRLVTLRAPLEFKSDFRPASASPMLAEMNDHAVASWSVVSGSGHPRPVHDAHERMLSDGLASSRFVRLPSGARVHLIEVGEGVPLPDRVARLLSAFVGRSAPSHRPS